MPQLLHLIGVCVFMLYVLVAMVLIGTHKVGHTMAAVSKTHYRPGSSDVLLSMSRRLKVVHIVIFALAAVVAFWPRGG